MLLSLKKNGLTSLFKDVRVFQGGGGGDIENLNVFLARSPKRVTSGFPLKNFFSCSLGGGGR